jgi:hypothetical protein
MEKESFNYTISSDDRTNTLANQIYYDVDFGGFSNNHDDYRVEVVNYILNGSVLETNGYLILIAEDLHDNGVFCNRILSSNESVVCVIPTNVDVLMSNGGVSFKANNCRMKKNVKFKFLLPDFTNVVDGVDINLGGVETKWLLTLRMVPYE